MEEDSYDVYVIRASKKWLSDHFDSNHIAKDAGGIQITALADKVSNYDISRAVANAEGLNFPLGKEYCLNIGYKTQAVIRLASSVVSIILILIAVCFAMVNRTTNSPFAICLLVGLCITLFLVAGTF